MRVTEICVLPDVHQIEMTVEMPDPDRALTSHAPHVPRHLFRLMPRLRKHTCHNGEGKTFCQECRNTEIPHLFEHLILELQLLAQENPTDVLRGETEWNWHVDPRGRYHVRVEYDDELLAVASIRLAERILRLVDSRSTAIDMKAEIARLRGILLLGRELAGTESEAPLPQTRYRQNWELARRISATPQADKSLSTASTV